ncbi:glycoside hydrolase domain-containing protein [Faecalimonas sp.]
MKKVKKAMAFILSACMLFQMCGIPVFAEGKVKKEKEYTTIIPYTKQSGDTNFFTFAQGKWDQGDGVHTWSNVVDTKNPNSTYYEVKFTGHKIDVYAGKNYPMGKVKYIIDGLEKGTYSLYNPSNQQEVKIATFDGLSEKEHILKAVATGEKEEKATDCKIDAGKVVVYHERYKVTSLEPKQKEYTLAEGRECVLEFDVKPSYADRENITFSSSDEKVVTVTKSGKMMAEGVGEATVTLESKESQKKAAVKVKVKVTEGITELDGTIVDSNQQYTTEDKYDTVSKMGKVVSGELSAWKNDTAVSQISLYTKDARVKNVSVSVSDFVSTNGAKIDQENIEASFVKSVQAYTGMSGYGDPNRPLPVGNRKEASEVLYQTTPITVPSKTLQNVWLSVNVPKDVKAGDYTGTVTVKGDKVNTPLTFTYTLHVADATLKDATEFKEGFDIELWQNPYRVAEYYGVEPFSQKHFEILTPHMEKYKSIGGHAITTTIVDDAWAGQTYGEKSVKFPSMIKWTKKENGEFSFDYTDFDKWILFNKKLKIGDKIVCYSIIPWNHKVTYYDEKKKENVTVTLATGSSEWTNMWTAFLKNLMNHMEEKGWKEETYIGIDERGFDMRAFDLIDKIVGKDGEPFKTAGAMDGFVEKKAMAMRVDDLNVGSIAVKQHPAEFEKLRQEREEAGLRTTIYTCTGHIPGNFSLSAPGESYWTMLYSYSVGGEGYLRWAYDSWVKDPLRDTTHNAFEAGDCFLIFPDEKDSQNPVSKSSLRLEKMAEGVRDVNKLMQMKREVSAMGIKVDSLLKTVKAKYDEKQYYLTDAGKNALVNDMKTIKSKITELTKEYETLKKKGTTKVESLAIKEGSSQNVTAGKTLQLHAELKPDNLLNTQVKWMTSSSKIATVSKNGLVTGKKTGTVTITATSLQDTKKMAKININVKPVEVDKATQVSYYSFENDVNDSWGNRNGTNNGAQFVDGKEGKAISIKKGDTVSFEENKNLNHDWTVGYWVYDEGEKSGRNSVLTSKGKERSFDNKIVAGNLKAGVHVNATSGGVLTFSYEVPREQWVHLTWTNDTNKGLSLYANGILISTNQWTKSNDFYAPIDVIGGEGFEGKVDDLKIYNRALTQEEVKESFKTKGLNLSATEITLIEGQQYAIETDLVSDHDDKTITFTSSNDKVASVNADGVVVSHKKGVAKIIVENKAGGYKESVTVYVKKNLKLHYTIPQFSLPEENQSDIDKPTDKNNQYLGQPDMVMLKDNKTLITAYPKGHGCGPLVMKVSKDAGETWTEKTNIPESWKKSLETPTMYRLDMTDGTEKIVLITGRPEWHGNTTGGWDMSVSDNGGKTWTESKTYCQTRKDGSKNFSTVAMASLVQLKNESGEFIDKWMGVYHDSKTFVNYKSYLTFDEYGEPQWSAPETYLEQYRSIEQSAQICEVGMFRSPNGKRIVALARTQSHQHRSLMFYSDDEGKTWSEPEELQGALQGERHKAVYDPISNRLVVTFREIILDYNNNGKIENNDWMAGDWIAWVGTYEDLMEQNEGQFRILLDEDWTNNAKSGDTGYTGLTVQPNGTFIMDSYGHWDKEYSLNYVDSNTGKYNATTDLCYIRQAKFTLGEIEQKAGMVDKSGLQQLIDNCKDISSVGYTKDSFEKFAKALKEAQEVLVDSKVQQVEVDNAKAVLEKAYKGLVKEENLGGLRKQLEQKLEEAKKTNTDNCTEQSVNALKKSIQNAESTLRNENATKDELLTAINGLDKAIGGLVKKPSQEKPDNRPDEKPNNSSNHKQNHTQGTQINNTVKTGDLNHIGMWASFGIFALVISVVVIRRRKTNK